MTNTLLQSIIDDSLNQMFVVDKRGKTVFFPWGDKKQGYLLKSRSRMAQLKKFYKASFFVCFVIFLVGASLFHDNFWGIVGSMFISFGGWYAVYYLYTSRIVRSLPVATASYKDVALEKLEPEGERVSPQASVQISARWYRPAYQAKDILQGILHIWYRRSPGQVLMICFFTSLFTGLFWSMYRPQQWINADYLVGFFVCFLLGYGFFITIKNMESMNADWHGTRFELSIKLSMVGSWSLAIWLLYKFVVLLVT